MERIVLFCLVLFLGLPSKSHGQSSFWFGTGIELNTVQDRNQGMPVGILSIVPTKSSFFVFSKIQKRLGKTFAIELAGRYSKLEHEGFYPGNFAPIIGAYGYHKLSVQPSLVKDWKSGFIISAGIDMSFFIDTYLRFPNSRAPREKTPYPAEGFNIQYGPRIGVGYEWKRLLFQLDATFGIAYSDEEFYRGFIDTANYYGFSVAYGFEFGKRR